MELIHLLSKLGSNIYLRIRVHPTGEYFVGDDTLTGRLQLWDDLRCADLLHAYVTDIRPLWHAQELYIECVK